MKISDLKPEDIVIGIRVKSLISDRQGTVVKIDKWPKDDDYAWILWDGDQNLTLVFTGMIVNAK